MVIPRLRANCLDMEMINRCEREDGVWPGTVEEEVEFGPCGGDGHIVCCG